MNRIQKLILGDTVEQIEQRAIARIESQFSIADPELADLLRQQGLVIGEITADKAFGIPAYWRAVNVVAGTVAGLPLKSYADSGDGRKRVKTFLDDPAGPYTIDPFEWKERLMLHLLNTGESFLLHVYNGAGNLIGLLPVHPAIITDVQWRGTEKVFTAQGDDGGTVEYTTAEMTQIMGPSMDGLRGLSPLRLFRQAIKTGLALDMAAYTVAGNGLSIGGLVTPDADMDEDDAKAVKAALVAKMTGPENAGGIAVVNRALKFSPWTMTNADAQFIESREFQAIEFARMLGVPPHLVGATEKQTSWGTGVQEQNLGLARFTLRSWTSRIEEKLSRLLASNRFVEFDFHGLLQGTPADEIALLIQQVEAGLLTKDEARAIMNRAPLPASEAAA